jgi:acyl-CoA reductase-like NAD-dependent aldehyde dehydrogenase
MLVPEKNADLPKINIRTCRHAQREWSRLDIKSRLKPVKEIRHLVCEKADDITAAIHDDIQRKASEVVATDILPSAAAMKYLEQFASKILKPRKAQGRPFWLSGCQDIVHRRPFGVMGIIGTWNYPLFLNIVPIIHSLVAGNGVIWKPSENTPRTAQLIHDLIRKAGFPEELFVCLPADREYGPLLAESEIDFVHFTGSENVGKQLATRLGQRLIPSTMELSGIDACFVLQDADPEFAAKAVWYGVTLNNGQTCMAVRRVFVEQPIFGRFVDCLRKLANDQSKTNQANQEPKLLLPSQVAMFEALIQKAKDTSLEIITTETQQQSAHCPAFILNPPNNFPLNDQACFAPIASVTAFSSIEKVIEQEQNMHFGLTASLFTSNTNQAAAIASQLNVGSVVINDVIVPTAHPGTPFGGQKASGWGSTQGDEGLLAMTVPQVVSTRSGRFRPHVESLIEHKDPSKILGEMLNASHSRTLKQRMAATYRMIKAMMTFNK